jgi:phage repressor protein C with HTH and peptisase S24 domain
MNELLVNRLRSARLSCALKQQDVAEQLGLKANTISNWEKGKTEPDIDTFVKLCEIYKIDCSSLLSDVYAFKRIGNDISLLEYEHIKQYRVLDDFGKETIDIALKREVERSKQIKGIALNTFSTENSRVINYYYRLASAGTGQIVFDTPPTKKIQIPDIQKYKKVDYAIGVNGNSMEPICHDGDMLLVEMTEEIYEGEIGIFLVDGESYVKKMGYGVLISLNQEYKNIPLTEDSKCMGRVIDILKSIQN